MTTLNDKNLKLVNLFGHSFILHKNMDLNPLQLKIIKYFVIVDAELPAQ